MAFSRMTGEAPVSAMPIKIKKRDREFLQMIRDAEPEAWRGTLSETGGKVRADLYAAELIALSFAGYVLTPKGRAVLDGKDVMTSAGMTRYRVLAA